MGCGGATFIALRALKERFGAFSRRGGASEKSNRRQGRSLIVHAGGFSKRLPNHASMGKVFAPCPLKGLRCEGVPTLLEAKLALFSRVPSRMADGVFVMCGDDLEVFDSSSRTCRRLSDRLRAGPVPTRRDRTRPSEHSSVALSAALTRKVKMGCSHGVFAVENVENVFKQCLETDQFASSFAILVLKVCCVPCPTLRPQTVGGNPARSGLCVSRRRT